MAAFIYIHVDSLIKKDGQMTAAEYHGSLEKADTDIRKMEVLAPAGSRDAFIGAVNAGADAVYLGGSRYGARAYAENFGQDELVRTIKDAHILGRRVYLTVNTLTRNDELDELESFLAPYAEAGLDGVIVQDLGVLETIHRLFPRIGLHASTQMSVTGREAVRFLKAMGCSRIVPARELSLKEIKELSAEGLEIECFAHGAMCYSYSGRCLFSSFLGGRSGNRGRCAGTCRLPYTVCDEDKNPVPGAPPYPLSMKDLNVLQILPQLYDAGITSLKIEGRMKKAEYAAGVSAIYRKYTDRLYEWIRTGRKNGWQVDSDDLKSLQSLYIRSSVSDGYYNRQNGRELITPDKPGYLGSDDEQLDMLRRTYLQGLKPVEITAQLTVMAREPLKLSVPGRGTFTGDIVEKAKTAPAREEQIISKMTQKGDSPVVLHKVDIITDNDSFIAVSSLKELRRKALSAIEGQILQEYAAGRQKTASGQDLMPQVFRCRPYSGRRLLIAVSTKEQLAACMDQEDCDIILPPWLLEDELPGCSVYLSFPEILRAHNRTFAERFLSLADSRDIKGVLAKNPETLMFLHEHGYTGEIISDSSLYIWNRAARDLMVRMTSACVTDLELSFRELEALWPADMAGRLIVPVYQRAPLMISAGCVRKTALRCAPSGTGYGFYYLKDRMDGEFPVLYTCGSDRSLCQNIVFNSVPTSLHNIVSWKPCSDAASWLISFTVETADEAAGIIRFYRSLSEGKSVKGSIPAAGFTYGHARKGAE